MLCCCRIKTVKFIPGICRQVKFLFKCSRYVIKKEDDNPTIGIFICRG